MSKKRGKKGNEKGREGAYSFGIRYPTAGILKVRPGRKKKRGESKGSGEMGHRVIFSARRISPVELQTFKMQAV